MNSDTRPSPIVQGARAGKVRVNNVNLTRWATLDPGRRWTISPPVRGEETVRILVVEDEFLVRVVACEALLDEGFEVTEAATGADALALIDQPVDVLLTDVIMPGPVDGWEVAERFRERWPQVSVIYTSGYPLDRRPVSDGALLMKPYRIAELIAAVRAKQRALDPGEAA